MTSTVLTESTPADGSERLGAHWSGAIAARIGAVSGVLLVTSILWLIIRHQGTPAVALFIAWLFVAALVVAQYVVSLFAKPFDIRPDQASLLDEWSVVVLVPCYNEEPSLLESSLRSMMEQTRRPDAISVIDDGSNIDYESVERVMRAEAEARGIRLHWKRTENHGKRYALINAARREPDADIYVTVDSDSILDSAAIGEGIKPFVDDRIHSVAGFLLVLNHSEALLSRMMELIVVSWGQLERSALSVTGSVLVNSGACAFYRSAVIRENAADFLSETIFGRPVSFSDDSLLTLFALERGRAVQQPTSFAFSRMPTELRSHLIQQTRWMRGAFVRAWWRFKFLPVGSVAYWVLVLKWLQFVTTTVLAVVIVVLIFTAGVGTAALFGIGWVLVQFAVSARYLALRRTDQSRRQRWATYGLVPLMVFWQAVVLHQLRLYAYATFARTAWGNRSN